MRLTLRTLLAYLDDLLEPSQAKELGAKVQESEVAAELVMKIRDVIRKRRLTAPVVSGPGCDLDANIVAEYLDNTLSPDGVTDLERLCLESDVHLAEVAASHQILTLVLGEPVDISSLSRERMYALGESARSKANAAAAAAAPVANGNGVTVAVKPPVVPTPAPATTANGLGPAVKSVTGARPSATSVPTMDVVTAATAEKKSKESVDRTVPDYLKTTPLWKRALPVAVALLFLVWLGMIFSDPDLALGLFGRKPQNAPQLAGNENNAAAPAVVPAAEEKTDVPDTDAVSPDEMIAPEDQGTEEVVAGKTEDTEVAAADKASIDVPPSPNVDETTEPIVPTPAANAGTGKKPTPDTEVAKADTNPANANPPMPPKARPAAPAVVRSKQAQYVSQEGIVLHYDADRLGWFQLPHRAYVFADDALAVPEPFDAQVQLGNEKHQLTVMGPAIMGILDPTEDQPMGINLLRGRVVLQPAEVPAGKEKTPLKIRLSVQGATWLLELTDSNTRCGIEVIPREPHQFEEDFGSAGWSGKLYVWSGAMRITNSDGMTHAMMGPDSFVLAKDPTADETVATPSPELPNWERKLSPIAQKTARLFDDQFTSDASSARDSLLNLIVDKVYAPSRLAVQCLGLIGDYETMLEVLDRNDHYESRVAAITSLRSWINQAPENRVRLKEAMKYVPEDAEIVYRLLWGFQEQDLRSKQISQQLVDYLEHDQLAIRELAWYNIKTLANRKDVFDARIVKMHTDPVVLRLQKLVEKEGSLLPPLATPKPPTPNP